MAEAGAAKHATKGKGICKKRIIRRISYIILTLLLLGIVCTIPEAQSIRHSINISLKWTGWQPFVEMPVTENESTMQPWDSTYTEDGITYTKYASEKLYYDITLRGEKILLGWFNYHIILPSKIDGQDLRAFEKQVIKDCYEFDRNASSFAEALQDIVNHKGYLSPPPTGTHERHITISSYYYPKHNWIAYSVTNSIDEYGTTHYSLGNTSRIYNLDTQKLLKFNDLFSISKEKLKPILWEYLSKQYEEKCKDGAIGGSPWKFYVSEDIYLKQKNDSLYYEFYYNPYDIAPFSLGIITIEVPASRLADYLRYK